jgi:hypothetical protein
MEIIGFRFGLATLRVCPPVSRVLSVIDLTSFDEAPER